MNTIRMDYLLPTETLQLVERALVESPPHAVESTCLICYEDVLYTTPDPDSRKYTHLMCCSKRICDGCSRKMRRRGACPFCNQNVLDMLLEQEDQERKEQIIIGMYTAGVSRGDADSYFSLACFTSQKHENLSDRIVQALIRIKFQPAMFRFAIKKMHQHTSRVSSIDILMGVLSDQSPIVETFREVAPILAQLEPNKLIADTIESAGKIDEKIRQIAMEHGINVTCDYCASSASTYACPCGKSMYCNQRCQAAHWNAHACDKKKIQLVGLSKAEYNGMCAERVRYNRKKRRYVVRLEEGREVLIDPLKTYVLT